MTNAFEGFDESQNEDTDNRGQMELLENILDTNKIIVRLGRLLKSQSELFQEEIETLEKLLRIVEKYKIIFEPGEQRVSDELEVKSAIKKLLDDENLDNEIYQEIYRQLNVGQQILDAEQIIKLCEKLLASGKIKSEDEREIFPALKILENFKSNLKCL